MDISNHFSVKGRVAIVTGGSAGIGRMIATGLAAAEARVYICARGAEKVANAASEIKGDVIGLALLFVRVLRLVASWHGRLRWGQAAARASQAGSMAFRARMAIRSAPPSVIHMSRAYS